MLGYINRYIGTAGVIRNFRKDYDSGYVHIDLNRQLRILKKRIGLSRSMMIMGALALISASLSMLLIFEKQQTAGELVFAASLVFMMVSIGFSIYETTLSNRSLNIEINDILKKEKTKS